MLKLLFIVGSLRKDSFNLQLAKAAAKYLDGKAEVKFLDYKSVPFFNQDIEFPAPSSVTAVRNDVKNADGIWIFSPEYNHYFPGVLKNLLDWLSRPINVAEGNVLQGKPVALSGITPGMCGTCLAQDHLVTLLSFLNMKIMNVPRLTIPSAMSQVDEEGKLHLVSSNIFLFTQAEAFLKFVQCRV
ncbi:MAG: NAD(P)H-dependent oxidoreductase [Phascolarctobacterium sp.]|nr:NAD(P)H-dependent oxidoreductase [Phascolarctobacterium sp.]